MKLGETEKLLKNYESYSKSTLGTDTLTITDRRIIRTTQLKTFTKKKIIRNEIRTEDVVGIDSRLEITRRIAFLVWAIVFAVLAVASLVLYTVAAQSDEDVVRLLGQVGMYAAIVLFVVAICFLLAFFLGKCVKFVLIISTDKQIGNQFGFGVVIGTEKQAKQKRRQGLKEALKSKLREDMVAEMVDEIGALIMQAQQKAKMVELVAAPVEEEAVEAVEEVDEDEAVETFAAEEIVEEDIEEPIDEETEEAVEEAAEEAAEEATEEVVEEATEEVAEEAGEEVVEEATEEVAEEAAEEVAEEAAEEAAEEVAEEAAAEEATEETAE